MRRHLVTRACLALGTLVGFVLSDLTHAAAQVEDVPYEDAGMPLAEIEALFPLVFPAATRIDPRSGTPPVWLAYARDAATGEEQLAGFIFLTSDVPPEEKGYTAPIEVLVGMDVQGKITGIRVIRYVESLRSSRGDFLRGSYQEQFAGKRISDRFVVRRDIEAVSGATITSAAAARGIRNAARRVFGAYMVQQTAELTREEIDRLTWPELELRGFTDRLMGVDGSTLEILVSLAPIADSAMGELFLGDAYHRAISRLGRNRASERKQWVVGLDGQRMMFFRGPQLSAVRGQDTLRFQMADLVVLGDPRTGKLAGHYRSTGVLLSDPSLGEDDNFTWEIDLGVGTPVYRVEHIGGPALVAVDGAPAAAAGGPAAGSGATGGSARGAESGTPSAGPDDSAAVASGRGSAATQGTTAAALEVGQTVAAAPLTDEAFDPSLYADLFHFERDSQSVLARTLEMTSWPLVVLMAAMLALTTAAFFAKIVWLRWVTLAFTLFFLGFWGGNFLSVSHITAAIKVGPSIFLEDIPLLLLVLFTVITTFFWGRVFCGYLCPFGALQDLMEHIVPKKIRRMLPHPVHEKGQRVKYAVLGVILLPAIAGSDISIFQYFEPFGTVFFWSRSTVLWVIAAALLVGSAVIPRFYCRYVCPLGASLALASMVSPFRIKRVPHCAFCTVCERSCPTGAIRRERLDFRECVRCNICEVKLRETAGVCGHELAKVSRLIEIKRGGCLVPQPEPARE